MTLTVETTPQIFPVSTVEKRPARVAVRGASPEHAIEIRRGEKSLKFHPNHNSLESTGQTAQDHETRVITDRSQRISREEKKTALSD